MSIFDVSDDVVLVTGAAGGIGLALAKGFLAQNARVVLADKSAAVDGLAAELGDPDRVLSVRTDLTCADEIESMIDATVGAFGKIDVLVNAHGTNVRKNVNDYSGEEWDLIQDVNLKSVFEVTRRVVNPMKDQGYGRIVSLGSMQASICWNGGGRFSLAPYCASKAGVVALTKAIALEVAPFGVTVNALCPGFVDTPLVAPVKNDPDLYNDIVARTPVGRFATTDEIFAPALFLASRASSYVTGQAILVDGGWTIQ